MRIGSSVVQTLSLSILWSLISISSPQAWAGDIIPPCPANGKTIPVDDAQVLKWKATTQNQFLARAHVTGTVTEDLPDHTGHDHFIIQIGPNPSDILEVVYNHGFGDLPRIVPGMQVEACGDYITSNAATAQYPASPAGAIIHYIHKSTNHHDSGFLVIDGRLYGQEIGAGSDSGNTDPRDNANGGQRRYSGNRSH